MGNSIFSFGFAGVSEVRHLYNDLNPCFDVKPHITANLNKFKRSLISQIRIGSLSLQVELGRYHNLPRNERICTLCNEGIEDEIHFLFMCDKLSQYRIELYYKLPELLIYPKNNEQLELLSNKPYIFANYLTKIWQA